MLLRRTQYASGKFTCQTVSVLMPVLSRNKVLAPPCRLQTHHFLSVAATSLCCNTTTMDHQFSMPCISTQAKHDTEIVLAASQGSQIEFTLISHDT